MKTLKQTGYIEPAPSKLHRNFHEFVDNIVACAESPSDWPLTQAEQIAFIRKVIYQAKKLRNTEEYLAEAVKIASEDLSMAS